MTFHVGDRIFAVSPGAFYQRIGNPVFTVVRGVSVCTYDPPLKYWMEITHVGDTAICYDSFIVDADNKLKPASTAKMCSIEALQDELDRKTMLRHDPTPVVPCTYTICAEL